MLIGQLGDRYTSKLSQMEALFYNGIFKLAELDKLDTKLVESLHDIHRKQQDHLRNELGKQIIELRKAFEAQLPLLVCTSSQ